jgi:CMP-N-acetylneuraminate monooxygenase
MNLVASFNINDLKKINYLEEINEYLIISNDGSPTLLEAICRHEGAPLPRLKEGETCITCPRHGWILDLENSCYTNPIGINQLPSQHHCAKKSDDEILIFAIDKSKAKKQKSIPRLVEDKQYLQRGEANLIFLNHASIIFSTPDLSLVTDPWIMGGAFATGWFLSYRSSFEDVEKILYCEYCYISHSHPDHLNPLSLIYLKSLGWNPTFVIPSYSRKDRCQEALETLGFSKFIKVENHEEINLDSEGNAKLLMIIDSSGRNDSGILISYKGHTVVNLVDCPSPDIQGISNIDIALLPFANGASGYPVCWEEILGIDKIREIKKIGNLTSINTFLDRSSELATKVAIPFAGYFSSLLGEDKRIDILNTKNTPEDVEKRASKFKGVSKQYCFDVLNPINPISRQVDNGITISSSCKTLSKTLLSNAEVYRDFLAERYSDFTQSELVDFLSIQDFKDDLVVYFRVCDIHFEQVSWSLLWDFRKNVLLENTESIAVKGNQKIRSLFISVRQYALGYTIRNSLPWEEFSIGFQARFNRSPDVYNFSFWDYFQNSYNSIHPIYGDILDFWKTSEQFRLHAGSWFQ